ncbi:MAG: hypothetical protein AAF639_34290 [Chloroflexota bacterium]
MTYSKNFTEIMIRSQKLSFDELLSLISYLSQAALMKRQSMENETDKTNFHYSLNGTSHSSNGVEQTKKEKATFIREETRRIQAEIATLPVVDTRSADEILGYDENGLPS